MAAVLRKSLHDTRRTILWLAFGLGLYALFIMAYYPTVSKQGKKFDDLLKDYPKSIIAMVYQGDPADFSISNPGNWIGTEFMSWILLIIGALIIGQTFNALTNAERDGTLDLMLSFPVSRRTYLLGRIANTAILVLVVLTTCFLVFAASTFIWKEFDVSILRLAIGVYGAFFPLMVMAGFTTLLATTLPSSSRFAGPAAYLFMMGSYLVHSFSIAIDKLHPLRGIFLFHYYDASVLIRHGVRWGDWGLLAAVALIYFALAWWWFDKKELGV